MAIAFVLIGLALISSGIRGQTAQLGKLVASDLTGAGNFFYFVVGIFVLGSIGHYPPLRNVSHLLIALVILVLLLDNTGFFAQLQAAVAGASAPAATPAPANANTPLTGAIGVTQQMGQDVLTGGSMIGSGLGAIGTWLAPGAAPSVAGGT